MANRIPLDSLCQPKVDTLPNDFDDVIDYIDISSVDNESKTIIAHQEVDGKDAPSRARQLLQVGDVIVSTVRPNLNAVALVESVYENTLVGSTGYCVLRVKDGVDNRFVFYFCQSPYFVEDMTAQATGASYPAVTASIVRNSTLPAYSLEEQHKIAQHLDTVTTLISLRKQQIAKLDELVKARFVEMFEHEDYPIIEFGNICEFLRNGANIKQTKGAAGYPITRIETLANDHFNSDRLGYADIFDLTKYESYLLKQGDILISHINSVSYLGRAVQYHGELQSPVIHGMNLLCARIKGQDATYIEWYLKCDKAKSYIATITKKAVNQASITTTDLRRLPVALPPLELQRQFSSFVAQTDKQKLTIQQSLDKLELMKKALMQKYFG